MIELKNFPFSSLCQLCMEFETTMGLGAEDCTDFENEHVIWYRNVLF